jgi:hypothetical protein
MTAASDHLYRAQPTQAFPVYEGRVAQYSRIQSAVRAM